MTGYFLPFKTAYLDVATSKLDMFMIRVATIQMHQSSIKMFNLEKAKKK